MKKLLLPLALLCTLVACKKDDTKTVSRTSLVVGDWKINSMTLNVPLLAQLGLSPQIDLLDTVATCSRDDIMKFNADFSLYQNAGAVKCDSTDSTEAYGGTWALVNSEKEIQFTGSEFGNINMKISELSSSTMHFTKDTVLNYSGINLSGTADVVFVK